LGGIGGEFFISPTLRVGLVKKVSAKGQKGGKVKFKTANSTKIPVAVKNAMLTKIKRLERFTFLQVRQNQELISTYEKNHHILLVKQFLPFDPRIL